jgi:PAS domain S-box-containing protein
LYRRLPTLPRIDLPALFDASPNPYLLVDPQMVIVGMNPAYLRVTMRSADEIIGRPVFEAFPSDPNSVSGRLLRQSFARVLAERKTDHVASIHYPIARPDGSMEDRTWSTTHAPLLRPDGEVACILQHAVDITELTRLRARAGAGGAAIAADVMRRSDALQAANLVLGEERALLRELFEQAPSFIAVLRGPDHVFESANAAFQQLAGVGRTIVGRSIREALPELEGQGYVEELDRVFVTGTPFVGRGMRVRLQSMPGAAPAEHYIDFVLQPLRRPDGAVDAVFAQGHDVTEQHLSKQAVLDSEERFRSLAHSMPNQVWTARPDGTLDWCNDQTIAYCGLDPHTVLADDWLRVVDPTDVTAVAAAWQRSVTSAEPYNVEFRLRRHDGQMRWHLARALPFRDAAGAVQRWVGTNTDIDDQKAGAALLADLSETLSRRVDERTEQLVQMQETLRQSQKMEAIGNLAGGFAHDFNNLLQVISGNLQLLARQVHGQEAAASRVSRAMAGVTRGARLASQLLAFARRQPLAPEVLDVGRLIRAMDDILRGSIGEAVEIETVVAVDLWNTLADAGNVETALLNLVINARDAMDGHGRLTITVANESVDETQAATHPDAKAGDYVTIAVTDTGSGMTPDVASRAFEPFFTTKPEGHGTGLGLSMIYGFVMQSGGHLRVTTEPQRGTTIRLYLPRSTEIEPEATAGAEAAPAHGSGTVLVVEDDEAVRDTTVALLEELGYRVVHAADADSALAIVESGIPIDLLFTDVVMPGRLKSAELARRATARLPRLAVLFTSGYSADAIVQGGRVETGVHLLGKPYTREGLAAKTQQVLAEATRRGPESADAAPTTSSPSASALLPVPAVEPPSTPALPEATAAPHPATAVPPDPGRLRVLMCEDDELVRLTLAELLDALDCETTAVAHAAAARAALEARTYDLFITDLGLPDEDGQALARWATARQPQLTVAIASGRLGRGAFAGLPHAIAMPKPFDTYAVEQLVARAVETRGRRAEAPAATTTAGAAGTT